MNYNNSLKSKEMRSSLGSFISDYSKNKYNKDWDYCLGLSYRYNVKNLKWRNNIKGLFKNLYNEDNKIDGFIINEYDSNFSNIHHHLIIKSDLKERDFSKIISKSWDKIGLSDLKVYDSKLDYCNYIVKHYGKGEENEIDMLVSLI
jgi:hypothetical protein